jgi:hypothetical protein
VDQEEAFFVPDNGGFVSTVLTQGPWDSNLQHGGPPSALVGRQIELTEPREQSQIARVTIEILKPIPIVPMTTEARIVRPGRSVELIEGSLSAPGDLADMPGDLADMPGDLADMKGEDLIRARAWRIRTADVGVDAVGLDRELPPGPEHGEKLQQFDTGSRFGYGSAMDWRFVKGSFLEPGPATAWMKMQHPLVRGEEPTPLTRVLIAADSGNGISATIDFYRYFFINSDLTVHLVRLPEGEWVCLDSRTSIGSHGIGLTETVLFDETGWIGRATQTLMVGPRTLPGS